MNKQSILIDEIPFLPFNKELKDIVFEDYLLKAAFWLLGKDRNKLLTREYNDIWETGYCILLFDNFKKIIIDKIADLNNNSCLNREELKKINNYKGILSLIQLKTKNAGVWLIKQKNTDSKYTNWDKVTWDTSIVCRSLIILLNDDNIDINVKIQILDDVSNSIRWLHYRFKKWDEEIKYPFGPADIAQILITITSLGNIKENNFSEIIDKKIAEYQINLIDFSIAIIEYLLKMKCESIITHFGEKSNCIYWNDLFTTAEVIESLALFDDFILNLIKKKSESTLKISIEQESKYKIMHKEVLTSIIGAMNYIEHGHNDGIWGSHMDTLRVLISYVKVKDYIHDVDLNPEPHIVFKALRWICDEKQVFADGSLNHVIFFTLFYFQSLIEVYNRWSLAKKQVGYLYDDILWYTTLRTTPERMKRLSMEIANTELIIKLETVEKKLGNTNKIQSLFIGIIISIILTLFIGLYLGSISISTHFGKDGASYDIFSYLIAFIVISITIVLESDRIIKKLKK